MTLRDWLIVVGVIIILGILADGYRRMRLAKQDSLKMSKNMGGEFENTPLDDDYNPELPGGGARVVSSGVDDQEGEEKPYSDDAISTQDSPEDDPLTEANEPILADTSDRPGQADIEPDMVKVDVVRASPAVKSKPTVTTEEPNLASGQSDDREVIVINVDAKMGQTFKGEEIQQLLEACGLTHGEMSIYHRHEEDDLLSPVQFSVANAVEPGYFDPNKLQTLTTPGVSFFLSLPGPKDYMKAFDYMLETAQCFAGNLGGELSDERRSVLTKQTIEHFRHRVREFERKQLSKAKTQL